MYLVHSLGGLVAKQAMVHMNESDKPEEKDNFNATYAMLFFGVPNIGMNIDGIRAMCDHQPNEKFIMSLSSKSQLLRNLHRAFTDKFNFPDAQIVCFFENIMSPSCVLVCPLFLTTITVINLLAEPSDEQMGEYRRKDTRGRPNFGNSWTTLDEQGPSYPGS